MERRQQPTVEELLNLIILQTKALEFYADNTNYENNINLNSELFSKIEMDSGHQARFALEQSKIGVDYHKSLLNNIVSFEEELSKNYEETLIIDNEAMLDFKKQIENLKNYVQNKI